MAADTRSSEAKDFFNLGLVFLIAGVVLYVLQGEWPGLANLGIVFTLVGVAAAAIERQRQSKARPMARRAAYGHRELVRH